MYMPAEAGTGERKKIKRREITMKIVVCVKQVPDTKGGVKFNPDGTLDRGAMLAIMNPDEIGRASCRERV